MYWERGSLGLPMRKRRLIREEFFGRFSYPKRPGARRHCHSVGKLRVTLASTASNHFTLENKPFYSKMSFYLSKRPNSALLCCLQPSWDRRKKANPTYTTGKREQHARLIVDSIKSMHWAVLPPFFSYSPVVHPPPYNILISE